MQHVGAGLRRDDDLCAGALAVLRSVGIGQNVELPDSVDPQQLPTGASGRDCELAGAGVLDSI